MSDILQRVTCVKSQHASMAINKTKRPYCFYHHSPSATSRLFFSSHTSSLGCPEVCMLFSLSFLHLFINLCPIIVLQHLFHVLSQYSGFLIFVSGYCSSTFLQFPLSEYSIVVSDYFSSQISISLFCIYSHSCTDRLRYVKRC